jgi:type I restriction enzyme S subunit
MGATILKSDLVIDGKIPVFSATEEDKVFGHVNETNVMLNKGDIIIPARGNSIGHVTMVGGLATCTQTTIHSKRISDRIIDNYSFYYMKGLRKNLFRFEQTAIPQITVHQVKENNIVVPNINEQTAIANYLDEKTAQIDALIGKKQKMIELLEEEKQAVVDEAVSGKGKNWERKKLKYVAMVQSSNVDKKTNEGELEIRLCNYVDVYYSEFITDQIEFMKASASEKEIRKFTLREGDVLITKDSETPDDIAKPALVTKDFDNVICAYHLAQIRVNKNILIGEFLFRLFQSKAFNSHFEVSASGVTRFGLPLEAITDVEVSFPSSMEQQNIVSYIQTEIQRIHNVIFKIQKEISLLQEYRTALISEAVTGKIKVA